MIGHFGHGLGYATVLLSTHVGTISIAQDEFSSVKLQDNLSMFKIDNVGTILQCNLEKVHSYDLDLKTTNIIVIDNHALGFMPDGKIARLMKYFHKNL